MPARKTSELLREAKRYLVGPDLDREGKTQMVCFAIGRVVNKKLIEDRRQQRLMQRIRIALSPYSTVCAWLHYEHGVPMRLLESPRTGRYTPAMQAYRHRWLDSLINEYAAKGD